MALAVLVWLVGLWLVREPVESGAGMEAVFVTAWCAAALWVAGAAQLLALRPASWACPDGWLQLATRTWMLGAVVQLLHVAVALDRVHHWSLASAYRETERQAGVGAGVVVNFLFVLVWLADAVWLTAFPIRYGRRPGGFGWSVHGFLAFVLFNATVVYGSPGIRWLGVASFALLAWEWGRRRWRLLIKTV
jgi:hypothetical protein